MTKKLTWLPALMLASLAAFGCAQNPEEDSCNIKTGGIYVEYEVFQSGGSATAEATFWVGDDSGGTFLTLGACGDAITVNGQPMGQKSGSQADYYQATLGAADSYEFVFTRVDEDPYSSTVSAPPSVNITAPTAGTSLSRAEAFDLTWEANSSGSIDLLIAGDCIKDYPGIDGESIPDNGSHTVNAGAIEPFVSSDAEESCSADIELKRTSGGALSPSLKGTIKGHSLAGMGFTSTP